MSNIDKCALREAAENATPGEWCADDHYGVIADAGLNANYYIASCSGPDNRSNKRFIAAANPSVVLALLDERERNQQYIKSRDQENEDIALTVGKLRVELEETKSKLNEQREYYDGVIADGSKRIAELEARTVTPPKNNVANVGDSRWMWYQRDLMWIEAIRAAGIKVKGE